MLGPYQEQTRCSACMQVAVWCVPFAVCHVPCVSCALCPLCHEHMLHTPRSGLVSAAMKMTDALRGPQFVVSRPALQVLYFGAVCLSEGVPHPAPRSSPCPSPSPPPSHLTPHTSHLTPHSLCQRRQVMAPLALRLLPQCHVIPGSQRAHTPLQPRLALTTGTAEPRAVL